MQRADLVVVGGGHAGSEAAAAAARLGLDVVLVTLSRAAIGRLSCNPAIGGLAKGHLVRELDALGGLMARVADATTVQFRRLNTRKGLAVRSSRAQVDLDAYPEVLQAHLRALPRLRVVEDEVTGLALRSGRVAGVQLARAGTVHTPRVILTTGTFLAGVMHAGDARMVGGRVGDGAAHALSEDLRRAGLRLFRLKTGTVPRLAAASIDWSRVERQDDVVPDGRLSFADVPRTLPPLDCHLTWTNPAAHALIRDNLHRSAMYGGRIEGVGPRYCPSIEDKIVRFGDRDRHLLFLEREGHRTDRVYVAGLSTSLPVDVQTQVVRAIEGLEHAEIVQPGYAVEYDVADPRDLDRGLQHRAIPGLWLAGQVNGTSGYEEAAVQGFVAGVSAARGAPLRIGRHEGYIGVLVDDLVTRGVGGEPYRMFPSRAEHRLALREDTADRRLMPVGRDLGLVDDTTWAAFEARQDAHARADAALDRTVVPGAAATAALGEVGEPPLRRPSTLREILRRPGATWDTVRALDAHLPALDADAAETLVHDIKYDGYVARAARRAADHARLAAAPIPTDVPWAELAWLSGETRERLARAAPATLADAAALPGITPAAVDALAIWLAKQRASRHDSTAISTS